MTAQNARNMLIKFTTDDTNYQTLGGVRTRSISFNNEQVDITDDDSSNQWRELAEGAGIKTLQVQCQGIFKNGASEKAVRSSARAGTHLTMRFILPNYGQYDGDFQVSAIEESGEYNGVMNYNLTFDSAGEVTFTAA